MRAIWYFDPGERLAGMYITDLSPTEWTMWFRMQYGSVAITYVQDLSNIDAQRLIAKGASTVLRREAGV